MTEIDIWIEVFKASGFVIKDEKSIISSPINLLEMTIQEKWPVKAKDGYTIRSTNMTRETSIKIWFDYKTGIISSARMYFGDAQYKPSIDKDTILKMYKESFREYKLQSILE